MTDVLTVATGNLSTEPDERLTSVSLSLHRYATNANSSPHKTDRFWGYKSMSTPYMKRYIELAKTCYLATWVKLRASSTCPDYLTRSLVHSHFRCRGILVLCGVH